MGKEIKVKYLSEKGYKSYISVKDHNRLMKKQIKDIFKDFPKLPKCAEHPKGDGLVCGWCHNNRRKEIKFILKIKKKLL